MVCGHINVFANTIQRAAAQPCKDLSKTILVAGLVPCSISARETCPLRSPLGWWLVLLYWGKNSVLIVTFLSQEGGCYRQVAGLYVVSSDRFAVYRQYHQWCQILSWAKTQLLMINQLQDVSTRRSLSTAYRIRSESSSVSSVSLKACTHLCVEVIRACWATLQCSEWKAVTVSQWPHNQAVQWMCLF